MGSKQSKPKKLFNKADKISAKDIIAKEPSESERRAVAEHIHLPGGPGRAFCRTPDDLLGNIASNCITNCHSDCGTNCHSDCGTNCHSDCGTNCHSDCGTNCHSDCGTNCHSDCGVNCAVCPSERLDHLYDRLDRIESIVDVRFGDVEKILERISIDMKNKGNQ